jgi:hypothetical protein
MEPSMIYLPDEWCGFRFTGRWLIGPDGDRITPHRLNGLLWRDQMELRRAGYASRRKAEAAKVASGRQRTVKVVIVELADVRDRYTGQTAG